MKATPRVLIADQRHRRGLRVLSLVLVCLAGGAQAIRGLQSVPASASPAAAGSPAQSSTQADEETAYVCPMHPDYTSDIAGVCPRCLMALVLASPYDTREYDLQVRTQPPVVRAQQPFTLITRIFHPGTHDPVTRFEPVHERRYHLFVISQDMTSFQHIHPEEQADGRWSIRVTLPKPGYYQLLSDFLPSLGSSQFIARRLVTAGYTGDLMSDRARLVPDTKATQTDKDITATVAYDPPTFVAGLYGHLRFTLTDSASGRPLTDLQTYLGAFGHTLIMSEDMREYVHSHPIDLLPPNVNLETIRGGPTVTFEGMMPKPGRYRAWTQFRHNDIVHTIVSTFEVKDPASP